jgi:hypothetical protein
MDYFQNRFEKIVSSCMFTIRMFRHDPVRCERCYQGALGEMEAIFNHHDCQDSFSKRLMNLKNNYQRQLKKAYLGF